MRRPALIAAAALWAACASPGEPPGGPEDDAPPLLIRVEPEFGAVRATPDEVVFAFDKVINEAGRGAGGLADLVLISPTDGTPNVRWRRNAITVRPRRGWRANTTYVVTLLPGVADLQGNTRDSSTVLVFSTGDSIPRTLVTGVVFDWPRGAPAARAYVQARPVSDTSVVFAAETDSVGRFRLPYLTPGEYLVRGLLDANRNRTLDARELWDTTRVALRDSAGLELYAFLRDTIAPRVANVVVTDSQTVRVTFDRPLSPAAGYFPAFELLDADSARQEMRRIAPWADIARTREERARQLRDSIADADTSTARRAAREQARRDSINRAAVIADSIARDPVKRLPPPEPTRPALVTEVGLELRVPLTPERPYILRVTARGVLGGDRTSERLFSRPRPAAPPPGTRTDTAGVQPPRSR